MGDAFRHIRDGYAEVMLCGGAEAAVTPLAMGGFTAMKALCESTAPLRASIPFDAERSGFVMGEGAGALLLEELDHAKARGAKIYAEVIGYGGPDQPGLCRTAAGRAGPPVWPRPWPTPGFPLRQWTTSMPTAPPLP